MTHLNAIVQHVRRTNQSVHRIPVLTPEINTFKKKYNTD